MKKGLRGTILLDTVDMSIMSIIKKCPMGVMELRDHLGIEHKNLKLHITRLTNRGLIKQTPVPRSRKIILSIPRRKDIHSIFRTFK